MSSNSARRSAVQAITTYKPEASPLNFYDTKPTDIFGCNVFTDKVMRERLPKDVYKALHKTIEFGERMDPGIADTVAAVMKDWAIEKGATHFTHIFYPLTGQTAEKHDSFLMPDGQGRIIAEFSGAMLIRGEPDASSFPSGGLRSTFEARGYTAWDVTSPAYIMENPNGTFLCIPTMFLSWTGVALDKKTPLLRSGQALNREARRVLKLFGIETKLPVVSYAGLEQEYFCIDHNFNFARPDLQVAGRSLFGARPAKGQEFSDQYFGVIPQRVLSYMMEVERALYKLGVPVRTRHNEAAPSQYEIAPLYEASNLAVDHNHIIMSTLRNVAKRYGLKCLLHEKPFYGVNGSGKHNNWSLATDTGVNLLTPGETPYENAQFLLFLCAVIQAVDDYQDLLRLSVATAGNDHRLGANEAPPAVVSIFLGDELTAILDAIEADSPYNAAEKTVMKLGVHVLPKFIRDTTDRNRTSPFAFTGNKFEFRMLGSSNSIACTNIMLNGAVAQSLKLFADELEKADDFEGALHDLIRRTIHEHKRIIFNGNGYDDAWIKEATEKRGLLNLRTTPDAMPTILEEKNVSMLTGLKIFTKAEIESRYEIMMENYVKTVSIEAQTMLDMTRREILPAVERYTKELSDTLAAKLAVIPGLPSRYETGAITKLSTLADQIDAQAGELEQAVLHLKTITSVTESAFYIRDAILSRMAALRVVCDEAETVTDERCWPFPTYGDLLFGVR